MTESGSMKSILELAEDARSLYLHSLGLNQNTTFPGLHSPELETLGQNPELAEVDTVNQHILEYALRSLHDKNALNEMAEELAAFYEKISIQLKCEKDLITMVDRQTLFKICIQNKYYIFIEAWEDDKCVQSVPVVTTAQFVQLIRKLERLALQMSIVNNAQTKLLNENVEKIKVIADRFRPAWSGWTERKDKRRTSPSGLYFDKRDAAEYVKKLKKYLQLDAISEDLNVIQIFEKLTNDMNRISSVDEARVKDEITAFVADPSAAYERLGRMIIGDSETLLDRKVLDLDRRLKQIKERVPNLADVLSDKPSKLSLMKNAFNENQFAECIVLLENSTRQEQRELGSYIEKLPEKLLKHHAEIILGIIERKLAPFSDEFIDQYLPVLIEANFLLPLTENDQEMKELFLKVINQPELTETAMKYAEQASLMRERANEIADRIYGDHQLELDEISKIEDYDLRARALLEVMAPHLVDIMNSAPEEES